jgi:hypothetical protein
MDKGTQVEMKLDDVLDAVIRAVGTEALSFYHPSRDFIITDSIVTSEDAKKITLD